MAVTLPQKNINLEQKEALIRSFPCFAALTPLQNNELALLFEEITYQKDEKIVIENELVDSVYIIVAGKAEVTRESKKRRKLVQVPVAVLHPGDGIGLNDTGFYSRTGKRTATVIATDEIYLLRLSLKSLYTFLKKHNLELSMYAASLQMLRMHFIKQSLPFAKVSNERLQWLADHIEELHVKAGEIIFRQGDEGDKCYLIRKGEVEIVASTLDGNEQHLATLKPPMLFGEATLITHSPRNATARMLAEGELLVLKHKYLSELIASETEVAKMFMSLMVDRSRPLHNEHVITHTRTTADGQEVTILKNPDNGSYFKLSAEGAFIWQQLDGNHTMQDLILHLAEEFKVFAPNVVAGLISKLTKAGFISNLEINDNNATPSACKRIFMVFKKALDFRHAFGDADRWLSKIYDKYLWTLFTRPAQIALTAFAVAGFIAFVYYTPNILLFFSFKHASLWLLLGLIPLSAVEIILHELGHAFAVKAAGREVHYMGIGWYWFAPVAFTDTTDIWLADRKYRMLVNLAGIYVDILSAGFCALLILVITNPYIQSLLWLFALYTYIRGFRMMSPLQDLDGYYFLSDWLEKTRLRQAAVVWLVKIFPKSIRHPALFREHWQEICYWVACIIFLTLVTLLTLTVQSFIFEIFEIQATNPYLGLALPFIVVMISAFGILMDIRNQVDE